MDDRCSRLQKTAGKHFLPTGWQGTGTGEDGARQSRQVLTKGEQVSQRQAGQAYLTKSRIETELRLGWQGPTCEMSFVHERRLHRNCAKRDVSSTRLTWTHKPIAAWHNRSQLQWSSEQKDKWGCNRKILASINESFGRKRFDVSKPSLRKTLLKWPGRQSGLFSGNTSQLTDRRVDPAT